VLIDTLDTANVVIDVITRRAQPDEGSAFLPHSNEC